MAKTSLLVPLCSCLALVPGLLRPRGAWAGPQKAPKIRDHGEMPPPKVVPGEKVSLAFLDLGRTRFEKGDLQGAVEAFTRARAEMPQDPRPLYLRGTVYQKLKRLAEAEADFRAALQLDPKLVDVRAELGAILTDSGRAGDAVAELERAVQDQPQHFEALFNLGVAHETLGHWPQAAESYQKAAKLRPQDADVRLNLAAALRKAGRAEEALVAAKEAVQLAPDDAQAHLNLGLMLAEVKRQDEALLELSAATRLDPKLQKAWWRLGVVHYRKGELDKAEAALGRARTLRATPEVLTDLGLVQRKRGAVPQAEASFRAALQLDGRYHVARIHLASTMAGSGRCKEALRELEAVPTRQEYTESVNRVRAQCQFNQARKR